MTPIVSILLIWKYEATKISYWLLPNTEQDVSSPANLLEKISFASKYPFPFCWTGPYMHQKFSTYLHVLRHHSSRAQHLISRAVFRFCNVAFLSLWAQCHAQKYSTMRQFLICLFSLFIRNVLKMNSTLRAQAEPKAFTPEESCYHCACCYSCPLKEKKKKKRQKKIFCPANGSSKHHSTAYPFLVSTEHKINHNNSKVNPLVINVFSPVLDY